MKKKRNFLLPLLMAIVMMAMSPTRVWADLTSSFMVMSDMHVMSKTLFDNGTAFTAYVQTEPKLVENSQDVFDAAIAKIKTAKPDFVLIPGDLTKDGEKVSHEYVAAKLKELVAQGINVYVVPGNHDITNPNAKSYLGEAVTKVTSLTADEWKSADFYQSCGYANAVMTSGLSYMAYPADGIALIALDSRKPDTETTHYSEGGLTEATLAWAESAAAKARAEGRVVIGMMHHPIMEHFDGNKDIGPTYLANQAEGYPALTDDGEVAGVQKRLVAAGIGTMFTGHFHLQSIQYEETTAGTLYDVMTGSLSAYPMAMRSGTIATNGNISVASITDVASDELIAKAKTRNAITTQGVFAVLANKMAARISAAKESYPAFPAYFPNTPSTQAEIMVLLNNHMKDSYKVLMNSLALGDEDKSDPNTKITACINAYDAFLDQMFNGAMVENPKELFADYTAQNTAMVTSVFQNTKGTGPVVADNTNTSVKTIALPTLDADKFRMVFAEINEARAEYSDPYTITFANSNNGLPAEKDADTNEDVVLNADGTIKLYHAENDYNYVVAPTTAGEAIMAPEDCSKLFKGLSNLTSITFINFNIQDPTTLLQALAATTNVTQNITLTGRTLYKDGYYNTLCLPFALSAEQLNADDCPLKGSTLRKVTGASLNTETKVMTISLTQVSALEAGKPYLIKWEAASENIENPIFNGVKVTTATPSTIAGDNLDVIGTFAPKTMATSDTDLFFLGAENKFYTSNAESGANLKGYRCYFKAKNNNAKALSFVLDDETTSINNEQLTVNNEAGAKKHIGNGRVVILRDGKKYNVNGQVIK